MNAPESRGKEFDTHMFVDIDHEGDKIYCRKGSDFLI